MQGRHVVVIDPGHGGDEPIGGSSPNKARGPNGLLEKDLSLEIGFLVRDALQGSDIEVILTRDEDVNLGLAARAHVARDNNAELFISIHLNALDDPAFDGTVVFTGRGASQRSQQFAQRLQSTVAAATGVRDLGVRSRNFGVIMPSRHASNTAAALLEVAFLTNPQQAERLTTDDYKIRIASAIATAIRDSLAATTRTHASMLSKFGGSTDTDEPVIPENIPLTPESGGRSIGADALEIGDIIVSTTDQGLSRFIRHVTGSQVSHASLYVGDGMVIESVGEGVILTTLEQALQDDSVAVALRYPGLTDEQKLMIRDFAGNHLDSGYDFVGIGRHLLYRLAGGICAQFEGARRQACEAGRYQISFGNDDADRWYCSELLFAAYEHAGASLGVLSHTSTPDTLVNLTPTLEYVGHLKSYRGEHGELEATSKSMAVHGPHAQQQQAGEAVIAGLELGLNAVVAVSGNTRDITWNLERLDGSYHPYHSTWTREEQISNGRGHYSMYQSRAYAYIENGFTDEISAKVNFSWEGNGNYIQNVFVNDPTDINDAGGWDLHITSKVRRNTNVHTRGNLNRIARVDLIFSWHFSNFMGGGTTCVQTFRLYANGHMEYRSVWDDNELQKTFNRIKDRSSNEPRPVAQSLENDYTENEIKENSIVVRGPEETETEWTEVEVELVAAAMPPRMPDEQTPTMVASYNRPSGLRSPFGMGNTNLVTPMSAYRHGQDHFGGIPIRSSADQRIQAHLGLNRQNQQNQRPFHNPQSLHQSLGVPRGQTSGDYALQHCAEEYARDEDAGPAWSMELVPGLGGVRALSQNLVTITHAGPYRLAYDRFRELGYGVIQPPPARDQRRFRGTASLQNALNTWAAYIPTVMTAPNYILTGGAYVDKPGEHGRGNAIDIDGFWWSETDKFMANDAPSDWYRYLTIEATLRKAFGTVLNYDYNRAHHDHWHCDLGRNTSWRRVSSQAYFAQRALNEIWGENLSVDGDWGDLSNGAATRNGYDFSTPGGWDHFLDDIINQQSTLAQQSGMFLHRRPRSLQAVDDSGSSYVAAQIEQTEILNQTRNYTDPSNFPVNIPEAGGSEDTYAIDIPQGMQFAHVDIEFIELSPLATAEVIQKPARGATGAAQIVVKWSHPPYGKIKYRVLAYASQDGRSRPVRVENESPGYDLRTKALIKQDVPVEYIVKGNNAKLLYEAIQKLKKQEGQTPAQTQAVITTAVVIVLILAAVVVIGMIVLYVIMHEAMERGYDVEDTKYKAAVGSGETRQEHELAFNLTKPR